MIKEKAEELVAALRSGKYEQGRSCLRKNDKFCCLGVACDISGIGKWEVRTSQDNMLGFAIGSNQATRSLPETVMEHFGFRTSLGHVPDMVDADGDKVSLAMLNDDGKSFEDIADFIEANWERL